MRFLPFLLGFPSPTMSSTPTTLGIIPARKASTRFPGKPLVELCGKPLLQWTHQRALACQELDRVVIATDDQEIYDCAKGFGAEVVMTKVEHPTGTDRIAEAATHYPTAQHIINIQGDEPLIEPDLIDALANTLKDGAGYDIVTAANEFGDEDVNDPNYVKVVLNTQGGALYFSRSPIPFRRKESPSLPNYRHKGIYGFQREALERFISLPEGQLEAAEQLEQLRALEHGMSIHVTITKDTSIGLDTPEQVPLIESQLKSLLLI